MRTWLALRFPAELTLLLLEYSFKHQRLFVVFLFQIFPVKAYEASFCASNRFVASETAFVLLCLQLLYEPSVFLLLCLFLFLLHFFRRGDGQADCGKKRCFAFWVIQFKKIILNNLKIDENRWARMQANGKPMNIVKL